MQQHTCNRTPVTRMPFRNACACLELDTCGQRPYTASAHVSHIVAPDTSQMLSSTTWPSWCRVMTENQQHDCATTLTASHTSHARCTTGVFTVRAMQPDTRAAKDSSATVARLRPIITGDNGWSQKHTRLPSNRGQMDRTAHART